MVVMCLSWGQFFFYRPVFLHIFRNKLQFFAAAKVSSSFPAPDIPEIAFAGAIATMLSVSVLNLRLPVGTINFFKLGSKLCLIDLPGYGFAYAKEEVKEAWEDLVST
ncbi:hypothetical protein V6N12_051220 [Hibiscus sabdariffa]|uniref:EngB-type G domain-containing protein n=1 Tax=Hibiscus sabdariffa TaxID=183260 RepID=A0ABR2GF64_9ROSI